MRIRSQIACLLASLPLFAAADGRHAGFAVGATVAPRVGITALDVPAQVRVTAGDIERGYVDVAATYRIASNDRRGYLLSFDTRTGLTRAIDVAGLANPLTLGDAGAEVHQQAPVGVREYSMRYRLYLVPQAREGSYELPVRVDVRPL